MLCCMAATMFLASCGESSTPSTDKNYYPLTAGNTWTYDGVETEDKAGTTTDIDTSRYTTTTRVDASLTYQGKSAYRLIDSTHNTGEKDTTYMSKSGSQVYTYIELIPSEALTSFGVSLDLGSRWVLIADDNQATWTIADTTIKGVEVPNPLSPGSTMSADIKLSVTGTKGGTSTMTVASKSVVTQEFSTKFSVTVVAFQGLLSIPITITNSTYVSENIGIVKSEIKPITITIPGAPTSFPINGSRETLKTYTVIN